MNDDFQEVAPQAEQGIEPLAEETAIPAKKQSAPNWLETLARLGLGEIVARVGTALLTLVLIIAVVWLMRSVVQNSPPPLSGNEAKTAEATATPSVSLASIPLMEADYSGVARMAGIHTNIPDRPRQDIVKYTIAKGDTVIGIAEKYHLKPQTIMFGNYYTLRDDPHNLSIGAELNILPVDGYYYEWQAGDGLNGVAKGLNVNPEDIINYPLNRLDPATIGDYSRPNIKTGTWLIVPGGTRPYTSWSAPAGVTRTNPAVARVMGAGSCGKVADGAVGLGYFVWPADKHYLSGFDYSPDTNHRGIDVAGNTGEPIYAVDAGVIVYAGWNDWGYGNMIMIDHGTGWQSLYGHLNSINVVCGQSVDMGTVIGTLGSTGRSSGSHLHFELMHSQYSKVNPWNFLPPP
jgi:murein DD-endopeptidase MepM/ murein hydrolase activator NlpD